MEFQFAEYNGRQGLGWGQISFRRLFEEVLRGTGEIKDHEKVTAVRINPDCIQYFVERKE